MADALSKTTSSHTSINHVIREVGNPNPQIPSLMKVSDEVILESSNEFKWIKGDLLIFCNSGPSGLLDAISYR